MDNNKKYRGVSGPTILSFIVIVAVVLWMANQLQMHQQEMSYSAFESEVEDGNVTNVYINQNSAVPTGTVSVTLKDDDTARRVNVSDVREVQELLDENNICLLYTSPSPRDCS